MKFSKKRRAFATAWGAATFVGMGFLAANTAETVHRQDAEVAQLRESRQAAAEEYLLQIPDILGRLETSYAYYSAEQSRMEEKLGKACLDAMLSDEPKQSFEDALTPSGCAYADDQLDDARVFYVAARSSAERMQTYEITLTDDPSRNDDTVDVLRMYANGMSDGLYPPEEVDIVVPTETGFMLQELETPFVGRPPLPAHFYSLWFYAGISTLMSGGYLVAEKLYRLSATREFRRELDQSSNGSNTIEDAVRAFENIDPDELGRIASELPRDI